MAGRPTKYKPEMCGMLIACMSEGMAIEEAAVELGVYKSTLYEWAKHHEEFSNAMKKGAELSAAWWLKEGRTSLRDRDFNSGLWFMNMKNRHCWTDKKEVKADVDAKVQIQIINYADVEDE